VSTTPGAVTPDIDVTQQASVPAPSARRVRRGLTSTRGLVGLTLVGVVVLAGAFGPIIDSIGPNQQSAMSLLDPSNAHLLGTDELGRDVFSRMLSGIRVDLLVVFIAVPLGAAFGALLGLISTSWPVADTITQRAFDVVLAFPALILAIALAAIMGPGVVTVSVVIAVAEIPVFGRLVRTAAMSVRELPYVESARVVGASEWWLLRRHILPNSLEPLTVQLAISMSVAVFIEGAMSFLGIGVTPPTPSLGSLIQNGMQNVYIAPLLPVGPLVVVCMLTLGFLLIAQALASGRRY
jgi:peptide/nickel transport system permease protein